MGRRIHEFKPVFVHFIPRPLEEGILYISEEFQTTNHLCACGCGEQTVLPINHVINGQDHGWHMTKNGDLITLSPSIGNFKPPPYHAHYYIRENKVVWAEPPPPERP